MTERVDPDEIEKLVGVPRALVWHRARAVSETRTVYILHSESCRGRYNDLRDCAYSRALDNGIDPKDWAYAMDIPVNVGISIENRLIPLTKVV